MACRKHRPGPQGVCPEIPEASKRFLCMLLCFVLPQKVTKPGIHLFLRDTSDLRADTRKMTSEELERYSKTRDYYWMTVVNMGRKSGFIRHTVKHSEQGYKSGRGLWPIEMKS